MMRRVVVVLSEVIMVLWVAAPASAFAHSGVANPYAHAALDVLMPAAVSAPLWTAYLWGRRHRRLLLALIAAVQVPVGVICFLPVANPALHIAAIAGGLAVTVFSLSVVRRYAASPVTASERP